jgi:hypothetical protein
LGAVVGVREGTCGSGTAAGGCGGLQLVGVGTLPNLIDTVRWVVRAADHYTISFLSVLFVAKQELHQTSRGGGSRGRGAGAAGRPRLQGEDERAR